MRRTYIYSTAAMLLVCELQQCPAALIWQNTPTEGATVNLKLSDYEEVVHNGTDGNKAPIAVGDELRGIFTITSIQDANTAAPYWTSGFAGQELTGYFTNYIVSSISGSSVDFTGGNAQVYIGTTGPAFNPSYSANDGGPVPHGAGYSDGELWLNLLGTPGVSGPLTTLNITYTSTTTPSGLGSGYFSILGGTGASEFKSDGADPSGSMLGSQDLKFASSISSGAAGWPASSQDPISGEVVPEASSLTIWGLLGLSSILDACHRRRRQR